MPETLPEAPPAPRLSPRERVAKWEPLLRDNDWTVHVSHTEQRARLEATHPSGATVMVTAGLAGRTTGSGRVQMYVLKPLGQLPQAWLAVKSGGFEEFARSRTVGWSRRVPSKCRCRTGSGHRKVRHTTERRANNALLDTRIQSAVKGKDRRAECRAYRCPQDDRVWHLSSRPMWREAPGDSSLWDAGLTTPSTSTATSALGGPHVP